MASDAKKVDELSRAERDIVVTALELKMQSVLRAIKSEKNLEVANLRKVEHDVLANLAARFR